MKFNKKVRKYCRHCKKHTEHTLALAKKRDRGSLKRGSIARAKLRGRGVGYGNLGKWGSKPPVTKFSMGGKKTSKKTDLRGTCSVCKKTFAMLTGTRMRKIEIKQ